MAINVSPGRRRLSPSLPVGSIRTCQHLICYLYYYLSLLNSFLSLFKSCLVKHRHFHDLLSLFCFHISYSYKPKLRFVSDL